jgi:hypothetical protein
MIMGKNVSYNRPDGKSVNGYLAGAQIPWDCEPTFTALEFLPPRPPSPSAATR